MDLEEDFLKLKSSEKNNLMEIYLTFLGGGDVTKSKLTLSDIDSVSLVKALKNRQVSSRNFPETFQKVQKAMSVLEGAT